MNHPVHDPAEHLETAEKVRTGEYFREGRSMYDMMVHDPMAERYIYIVITAIAVLIFFIAFSAMRALYPLETPIPFAVASNNLVEDVPRMKSMLAQKGENPSEALLRFLVQNYVDTREGYEVDTFERDVNGVRSQSTKEVMDKYRELIDPNNPDSPLTLYQRHSKRKIEIISYKHLDDEEGSAEVEFEATVIGKTDIKKTRWQANISFNYSGIALDDETGKVNPMEFVVTDYRIKRLQDVR